MYFFYLDSSSDGPARRINLISGVDSESDDTEPVIVYSLWMVEKDFPGLVDLVSLDVEIVVRGFVERLMEYGSKAPWVRAREGDREAIGSPPAETSSYSVAVQ